MPKNNSSINNSLFDLLKGRGYSPTMLSTAGKEIPTPDEAEVFQFNFVKDGEDYGKVTLTIDDSSNLIVYYSDDVADSEKGNGSTYDWDDFIDKVKDFKKSKKTSKLKEEDDDDEDFKSEGGDLSWYGLLNQLKRFAQRYQLSFELRNTDNLKSDMAKRDYMKKQDQISESKHHSMAEGSEYTEPKLGTIKANLMLSKEPTVQVKVFKHNTLRGDSYWVTKEVRTFKTMDQAQAYVDRINDQDVAEGSKRKKKKTSRSLGRYFFPGYSYYGSGESGESGDGGGGESSNGGMAESSTGVSVKKWAAQVRQEHGADTKFSNDKVHNRVIARKDKEIVGSYDRKANNGTVFSPKQDVSEGLNEFAPDGFNGGDDSSDLQLYINIAKKLNMKKYKPSTAHALIAKKMAELVATVDDDKVDYARHMARKAQGLSSMLDQQDVAEGYSLKKTNVEKTFDPGDPDKYTQDVNTTYTDYEIINNKTGQVVGTASWTTNDFMGPGALKITMKNGATRWLDIWDSEKGNPQTAFNRFVKDPKTAKKYKEQDNKGVTEMDNRTPSGDRREQRANSPEEKAKREKEQQANLKKVSPEMRKKLRLPEPKEDMAEGTESVLTRGTEVTVPHRGKMVPGKILRYVAGKGGYSDAYVVDIGEYESLTVPTFNVKTQGMSEASGDQVKSDDLYNVVIEYFNGGKGYKNAMVLRSKAENGMPVEDLAELLNNFLMKKWGSKLNSSDAIDAVKNIVYPHVLEQGMAEGSEFRYEYPSPEHPPADIKYWEGHAAAKNNKPSIHKTLNGNDRDNYIMGYKDGLRDRKKQDVAEGSEEKDPVWNKGTPMPKDYTCHCGIAVHPSVRNPKAIHIPDCPYAKKQDMAEGTEDSTQVLSNIVANEDFDALYDLMSANTEAGKIVQRMYNDVSGEEGLHPDDDFEQILNRVFDHLSQDYGQQGMAEGLEDSNIQDAIIDTVERLFYKNDIRDYGSLEAIRQGVKHHFSKSGATAESAIEGILNILNKRMRKSGNYVDLGRFKEALRHGVAHQVKKQGMAEEATKKLSKGAKVYHTLHGTGTVIDFSTGPGASHWVDVKFIKDGNKGKITRVDRKQLKLAKVESVAEGYYGDDRGDYRKTAREAHAASRLAKSSKTHAAAARLHNLAATYALSAGQDQSVIRDHQMAAHEHNQAVKKYKKDVAESNQHVNESYYPMGKQGSYSDAVPTTKIIIQHSRRIEEGEQRYRNIAKIFVENSEGERFAVPTIKPGLARVYARHIAEGGTPYDERGRHITSLVEEYSKMSGFMRATRGKQFNESAQQLVTEAVNYYQSLRESLSKMTGHRGYSAYFESWTPALMEDGEEQETNLNELFVQETLDPRIESVMPILGKLQRKLGTIKEVDALAEWADTIIEGDGGQEALNSQGIPEAAGPETLAHNIRTDRSNLKAFDLEETTGVTDYNPKSQGGTRAELLRKYAKTKKPKDAEAARRAGASQSELKAAADSTEEIHEGEHGLDENLDANQISAGQLGPTEKAKSISPVLGAQPKQHPFKGKLVGAEESVNESEDELARLLQMVKHKR